MSDPTLKQTLDKIMTDRGLTQKEVVKAISLGMGTFYEWRKNPDSATVTTLKKIRDFTENPDDALDKLNATKNPVKALDKLNGTAKKPQRLISTPKSVVLKGADCLAISKLNPADFGFAVDILKIMDQSSVTVDQVRQLAGLRVVQPTKE